MRNRIPGAGATGADTGGEHTTCRDRGGERGEAGGQRCRPCHASSHPARTFIVILTLPCLKKGFLPGEFHRRRSLVGYGPQTRKESDMTQGLALSLWASLVAQSEKNLTAMQENPV